MKDRSGGSRRRLAVLVLFTSTMLLLAGLAIALDRLGGRDWLTEKLARPPGAGELDAGGDGLGVDWDPARSIFEATLTALAVLYAAGLVAYAFTRGGWRRRYLPLAVLLLYGAIETLAAPHWMFPLRLNDYYYVRDPDHWPTRTDPALGFNADSLRCRHEPQEFRPEEFNLIFLGDSFTYGLGLPAEQTFAAIVEDYLDRSTPGTRARVANFGWTSSSPLLSLRRLEAIGEKYHPDFVVLCIDMTDFQDDLRYAAMLERRGIYAWHAHFPLATRLLQLALPGWLRDLHYRRLGDPPRKRFFPTEMPLEKSRPYLLPLKENVDRISAWCEQHGARFVVFVLPRGYQYNALESPRNWERNRYTIMGPHCHEPFRFFEEVAAEVDYPVHSLLTDFRETRVFPTCFRDDPHWNAAGARIAADAIYRDLVPHVAEFFRQHN